MASSFLGWTAAHCANWRTLRTDEAMSERDGCPVIGAIGSVQGVSMRNRRPSPGGERSHALDSRPAGSMVDTGSEAERGLGPEDCHEPLQQPSTRVATPSGRDDALFHAECGQKVPDTSSPKGRPRSKEAFVIPATPTRSPAAPSAAGRFAAGRRDLLRMVQAVAPTGASSRAQGRRLLAP